VKSEQWDERYRAAADSASSVWSLEPNVWIAETVGSFTPGTAVDLAAGEGRNALWLASRGWRVSAVDFSSVGLATGASRAAQLGLEVEWVTADATQWVAKEPVDLVVLAYLQLAVEATTLAIHNARDSLAAGGILALIGHDVDNIERGVGGPQNPAVLYTVDGVRAAAAGLDIIECGQFERETPAGIAIDTVLLARKPLTPGHTPFRDR
jgi:hypothetical protein